MPKMKT